MSAAGAVAFDTQEALIARAQAKDEAAFAVLVGQYQTAIVNYVYRTMGNRDTEDAHDLAQDTFLKAWKYIGDTQPNLKFGPWVYRIAQRVCLDALRHRKLVRFIPLHGQFSQSGGQSLNGSNPAHAAPDSVTAELLRKTTSDPADGPEGRAVAGEVAADVRKTLDRMRPNYRACLILREYGQLDYDEIAGRLGTTRPSVKSLLFRARQQFAELYEGEVA